MLDARVLAFPQATGSRSISGWLLASLLALLALALPAAEASTPVKQINLQQFKQAPSVPSQKTEITPPRLRLDAIPDVRLRDRVTDTMRPGGRAKESKPFDLRRVVCIGGRATRTSCVCTSGSARRTEPGVYVCRQSQADDVSGRTPACVGGKLVKRRCQCPQGTRFEKGNCTRIADTTPPPKNDPPQRVVCIGGRVVDGACRCRVGRPSQTGRNMFTCTRVVLPSPRPPVVIVEPSPPRVPPRVAVPSEAVPPVAKPRTSPTRLAAPPPPLKPPPRLAAPPPSAPPLPSQIGAEDTIVPDEIVALLPATRPQTLEDAVATTFGLVLLDRVQIALTGERMVRYRIPDGRAVATVVTALDLDQRLESVQANFVYRNQKGPAGQQGAIERASLADLQYALAKLDADAAHQLARGNGTVVAVIDSGVDATHPELAGALDDEIDVIGIGDRTTVIDPHGTAIAGIIAARGLLRGIAPEARVLSVRAFRASASGGASLSTTALIVAGIDRAVAGGAQILNLSFAGSEDPIVHRVLKAANARNILMVAAAGNKGPDAPPAYPAGYHEVIAVTAIDAADRLYAHANRGDYVAVAAPGVDVLTAGAARSHQLRSGTSFAAAHVSAVLALLRERVPPLTQQEAMAVLVRTATPLGAEARRHDVGVGRVSAAAALEALVARSKASATPAVHR